MRAHVNDVARECDQLQAHSNVEPHPFSSIGFALMLNTLTLSSSQTVVQVVHQALLICGIMGYKNDSKFSLGRHLRDAHSAAVMVANDRIYAANASMLLVLKDN